eukprot:3755520-Rhodomonas_salina.1
MTCKRSAFACPVGIPTQVVFEGYPGTRGYPGYPGTCSNYLLGSQGLSAEFDSLRSFEEEIYLCFYNSMPKTFSSKKEAMPFLNHLRWFENEASTSTDFVLCSLWAVKWR